MKWVDLGVMKVLVVSGDCTVVNREWLSWAKQHKRMLAKATLDGGYMGKTIRRRDATAIDTFVAFDERGEVKGWALIHKGDVHVFVHEQHRGRGLALMLLNLLIAKHECCQVSACDDVAWKLFSRFADQNPGKVEVFDYRPKQLAMEMTK